jgi:hypothetical protein
MSRSILKRMSESMQAEELAHTILDLDEPWRSRFLFLVASLATGGNWNGVEEPGQETLARWLRMDLDLRRRMTLMVSAWRRPALDRAVDPGATTIMAVESEETRC